MSASAAIAPLHVLSDSRIEGSQMDKARSQCLQLCSDVTVAYDSIAEKMSDYTTLATHLPRGFISLANEVLGACSELSSIYTGLSDASSPSQILPGDVTAVVEKKLRGAQGHMKALDQAVTKLLDHERNGGVSRLRRKFGKMFPSDHVEKLRLEATKMREDLKVGSLLLQWKLGSTCIEREPGIGCVSLAAAIQTVTGQPPKGRGHVASSGVDGSAYRAVAVVPEEQRGVLHHRQTPLTNLPSSTVDTDKGSSAGHSFLNGHSGTTFASNDNGSAARFTMDSTGSSNDGRDRYNEKLRTTMELDKSDETIEYAIDSLVGDIKSLELDSAKVVHMDSVPSAMPHSQPRTMADRDKPNIGALLVSAIRAGDYRALYQLLDRGASPDTGAEIHALNEAIASQDSESARLLLLYGASPNALDIEGQSPLAIAAGKSSLRITIALLKYGANPDAVTRGTHSPLAIAVSSGNLRVTHALLMYGANPNQMTLSGNTLLIESIGGRSSKMLTDLLLNYGAAPNEKSREGKTALFEAITNGRADILDSLIQHGADPNLPGPKHMLWPAIHHPECLRILLAKAADHKKAPGIMELATSINSVESIGILLKAGVDPNAKKDGVYTPLCTAIRDNRADILELLLRNGADPNIPASEYPAFKCITHHREHFLPALVKAGVKLDKPKGIAETAVAMKNTKVLDWLLKSGVDPNDRCSTGRTPLTTAIRENNIEMVDMLLAHGANPNIRGQDWPVCMAVRHPPVLERILSALQEPRAFKGVMEMAVEANQLSSVKLLRAAGVSVEDRNGGVFSPLTTAIRERRTEIVAYLIGEGGADVNAPGEHLPLVKALRRCHTEHTEIIDMLLEKGADPNKMYRGWNGIMQALENGDLDMLKKLATKTGVDIEVRDELGRTVTEIALSRRWEEAVNILLSSGPGEHRE
ncbi:hypothetical protein LMH87_009558 [Akanthomyces muscarius]|uniref:Ankyrin repeat protein n=1 Tax=Akanthomyces muscarius TaxID=2231603 RepID=A0A9W8QBL5_AKAMU|nr:hypothetical protein LMH87_009558 [Akanthomyces muscarius]KAJ4153050.1 hypothetical protein LMH87_009558 [Akanthomyces muscarius]